MRASTARNTGFVFLAASLVLALSILGTIVFNVQVWGSKFAVLGESGALHVYIVRGMDYSSVAGYRFSTRSPAAWNWRTARWPRHHNYGQPLLGKSKDHVSIPLWMPILALALAAWICFLIAKKLRRKIGCCKKCGYNLTGNTTGVCSECGTPIPIEANDHATHP